jgi:hypothetical protein
MPDAAAHSPAHPFGAAPAPTRRAQAALWAEVAALYGAVPLALAFLLPPSAMWPTMTLALAVSALMLHRTPGFSWRAQIKRPRPRDLAFAAGFAAILFAAALALTAAIKPAALLSLPRHAPGLWLMILALYPLVSALPQEVMFRTLFFTRYRALFRSDRAAMAFNAAAFSLAHLFLWNWVALALTAAGGVAFSAAYRAAGPGRGLMTATLLHALAGMALFTSGLGTFFYHGAVGAP